MSSAGRSLNLGAWSRRLRPVGYTREPPALLRGGQGTRDLAVTLPSASRSGTVDVRERMYSECTLTLAFESPSTTLVIVRLRQTIVRFGAVGLPSIEGFVTCVCVCIYIYIYI